MESNVTNTSTNTSKKKPVLLLILDGWGHREESKDNAIVNAHTPTWDRLWESSPRTLISSSGESVGLPAGQMGNSEVGHMSLGAGRIVYQSISRINNAIEQGDFFTNEAYCQAIDNSVKNNKALHIFGLLSAGGVHSHENHFFSIIDLAAQRGANKVFVHAFLDGRDTPPRSAAKSIEKLEEKLSQHKCGKIVSLIGRYYAMDRDNRWDRVEKAYQLLTEAKADYHYSTATQALKAAYARDETDEFVSASAIQTKSQNGEVIDDNTIEDGDSVIFMNFRADRAREITRTFVDKNFSEFSRNKTVELAYFVSTTQYASDIDTVCAFGPISMSNSFGELMEKEGKTQLRIAETEKYAHVTFFFSGGREQLYKGEKRSLIPSADVATYDLKPEMSAPEVTEKLVKAIESGQYDTIICNYANGDMVGHTGNYQAAIKAAEAIDDSLLKITEAIIAVNGDCLITADHGNCEQMLDYASGQPHTQHTTELVPLVYVGNKSIKMVSANGKLADVAPTLLNLMGVKQPPEMTGTSLINFGK